MVALLVQLPIHTENENTVVAKYT